MMLRQYLEKPLPARINCGLFIAGWLAESGVSDLLTRLDAGEVDAVARDGGALAFATRILAGEGFRVVDAPVAGFPVCVRADGGETLAISVSGAGWCATVAHGGRVAVGRWPLLRAWVK